MFFYVEATTYEDKECYYKRDCRIIVPVYRGACANHYNDCYELQGYECCRFHVFTVSCVC